MTRILIEAVSVGIVTLIIGLGIFYLIMKEDIPDSAWGKVSVCLFILGSLIHIFCEVTGINKWYCKNGNACNF